MEKPVTFAVCGLGVRGMEAYASFQARHPEKMKITAGADPDARRRAALQAQYGVPAERCFETDKELLAQPKLADVMIIATQDRQHVSAALAALEKGYHLVLEKPISPSLEECLALRKKAHEAKRVVVVCHVLRYTEFYGTLFRLLREGAVGRVESLDAIENIAYWHFAHSYVRGNWRRAAEASPMVLAKSCHDMDIIRWLMDAPCESVSSYGSLDWFRPENAPQGSADRCLDCARQKDCPYDAERKERHPLGMPRMAVLGAGERPHRGKAVRRAAHRPLRALRLPLRQRRGRPSGGCHALCGRRDRDVYRLRFHREMLPQHKDYGCDGRDRGRHGRKRAVCAPLWAAGGTD